MSDSEKSEAAVEELAALDIGAKDISYWIWFGFFIGLFAFLLFLFYFGLIPHSYACLVGFVLYMSLACSFFPLPTAWIVLWAVMVFGHPVIVAALGALGTTIANMNDYYLLTFFFKYDRVDRIRSKSYYHKAVKWFDKWPFTVLTAASFLPVPVDIVRLLAISRRYNRGLFAGASFLGRFPRYLIFTVLGHELELGWSAIIAVLGVTAAIGISRVVYGPLKGFWNKGREQGRE